MGENSAGVALLAIVSPLVNLEIFKAGVLTAQANFSPFGFAELNLLSYSIKMYWTFIIFVIEILVFLFLSYYCFHVGKIFYFLNL